MDTRLNELRTLRKYVARNKATQTKESPIMKKSDFFVEAESSYKGIS